MYAILLRIPVDGVSSLQVGHALYPFVLHPDIKAYAGKSLIVHITVARIVNVEPLEASRVSTPFLHITFNSSTNGLKNTSISFPGAVGPGIKRDSISDSDFIHFHVGRL